MLDRRQTVRRRVIYRGRIAFNDRRSTVDCVIRNISEDGVKVEFDNLALLPDEIDLFIAKMARSCRAKLAWRTANQAGLSFHRPTSSQVVPWDWVRRREALRPNGAS